MPIRHFIIPLILAHPLAVLAQRPEGEHDVPVTSADTVIQLHHAEVKAKRSTTTIKATADGSIIWNTSHLNLLPRIMGNADPIHYSQLLPGVQTNNEYHSNINVQGCDNAHSTITIEGVPIYNAVHLLGIFSTFNASHFTALTLRKTAADALHPARLGAQLNMELPVPASDSLPPGDAKSRLATADLEVGLVSTQGTVRIRPDSQTLVTVSGRLSYLERLYGPLLRAGGIDVHYTFGDLNATIARRQKRHTILVDTYYGLDVATFTSGGDVDANFDSRWGNNAQALHWNVDLEHGTLRTTAYHTAYASRFALDMLSASTSLPAHIDEVAIATHYALPTQSRITSPRHAPTAGSALFTVGFEALYRRALPQQPVSESNNSLTTDIASLQHGIELALPLQYTLPLGHHPAHSFNATLGFRPTLYTTLSSPERRYTNKALNPSLRIDYAHGPFSAALTAAVRHQYTFQTGFSDAGLPSEFWLLADDQRRAQSAHGLAAEANLWLPGRTWRISVDAYYKALFDQIEYDGTVFSILTTDYRLDDLLRPGRGYNWGASVMIVHTAGPLTGWAAYSYTRAQRQFSMPNVPVGQKAEGAGEHFPASHERPHEFNAVVTYNIRSHWALSATLVAASGTPFTAPTAFYLLAGNLISQFGKHNGNRLPPYVRADVSASYKWTRRRATHSVNLSLYNCTARKNAIFYTISFSKKNKYYNYAPTSFFTSILPSLSYAISF